MLDVSGHPSAHALYGSAKISPWALARLPELAHGEMRQRDDGKMVLNLAVSRPAQLVASLPLRAVVLPTVAATTGVLRRLPLAEGARALAPSTLFQLPGARRTSLSVIAGILKSVPVFGLDVGPDLDTIPAALVPAIEGR